MIRICFIGAALLAAIAPVALPGAATRTPLENFSGWPSHYEDRPLKSLPLSAREKLFVQDFPGAIGRFTDGEREIVIRFTTAPTRRLHPAADCFRGVGYAITPLPGRRNTAGTAMGCFRASRGDDLMEVCEYLRDERGQSWSDVGAWYWSALWQSGAAGPWWSFVIAQPSRSGSG
jgi:hypothetical protein